VNIEKQKRKTQADIITRIKVTTTYTIKPPMLTLLYSVSRQHSTSCYVSVVFDAQRSFQLFSQYVNIWVQRYSKSPTLPNFYLFYYGLISSIIILSAYKDLYQEQHHQHIVLVLACVHTTTQLVTTFPDGAVQFRFLYCDIL